MRPARFKYHRPSSMDEALSMIAELPDARIIAGGQSLIPAMMLRLAQPEALIDIGRVPGLSQLEIGLNTISIGTCVTHATIERSAELGSVLPILPTAARVIAHPAIRTRGTFGGSLAHGDPAAEWPTIVTLLGGEIHLRSRTGERIVNAEDFFEGPLITALKPDEMLVSVKIGRPAAGEQLLFEEFSRQAGAFAIAMVAVRMSVVQGRLASLSIVVGGCGDVPKIPVSDWSGVIGQPLNDGTISQIASSVADAVDPQSDLNASAEDRRSIVKGLLARNLASAANNKGA